MVSCTTSSDAVTTNQCLYKASTKTNFHPAFAKILSTSTMSKLPSKAFSNPQLQDDLENFATASAVIQIYTQMVLKQADIKLGALPDLPKHQQLARKNAKSWNAMILPAMANTIADIIDSANLFQSFCGVLVNLAEDISNPDSKKKLVEGLKLLHGQVQAKSEATQTVIGQLTDFNAALIVDNSNFQHDCGQALDKIVGSDHKIKVLGEKLNNVLLAMHNNIKLMARGAVSIGGIVMAAVGVALEIPTAVLIGGGFFVWAGDAFTETDGASDYALRMTQQKKIAEQLEEEKKEMSALKYVKNTLDNFLKAIGDAIEASQALVGSWNAIGTDMEIVINAIDRVNPSISSVFIVAELNAANKNWQVALDMAKQLQPSRKVLVKNYENLQDAFDEAKPKG